MRQLRVALVAVAVAMATAALPGTALAVGNYYPIRALPPDTATLNEPNDVVVAGDGITFVADASGGRVIGLSAQGALEGVLDGEDTSGIELQRPVAIDIGDDGLVYVADLAADRVVVFERGGTLVRWWDGAGSAGGKLDGPAGIDVDDGHVYVSDSYRNRVQVFTTSGSYVRTLGVSEGPPGLLSLPGAVRVWGGEVYVADVNNLRVQVYGTGGGWRRTWGITDGGSGGATTSRYQVITGIEVVTGGRVFVTGTSGQRPPIDPGTPIVEECTTSGALVGTWGGLPNLAAPKGAGIGVGGALVIADSIFNQVVDFDVTSRAFSIPWAFNGSNEPGAFTFPSGAAIAPDGRLYVGDSGRIQRFSAAGQLESVFGTSGPGAVTTPEGIAVSSTGDEVFVADSGADAVHLYSPAGDFQWSIGVGVLTDPRAVWVTPERAVFVADTGAGRIMRFTPGGSIVASYAAAGELADPSGVAVDASGTVYVSDTGHNRIVSYASTSSAAVVIAGPGQSPGQVLAPRGIAVDPSGDLVVVDAGNSRIQRLSTSGAPVAVLGTSGAGEGEFRGPRGIAVTAGGDVAVADRGNHRAVILGFDDVAPTTSVEGVPAGWSSTPVTVTVTGVDFESGVEEVWYRLGAGAEVQYAGPFVVSAQGTTALYTRAVDNAGNAGPTEVTPIRIDSLPPSGTVSWAAGRSLIATTALTLHAALADAETMRTRVGGSWSSEQPYVSDKTFTLPGEGVYSVVAEYKDWLGNPRTDAATITVDLSGPIVAFAGLPASGATTSSVLVGVNATDATAGVADIFLQIDSAPEQRYTGAVLVSGVGTHTLRARAVDSLGNASAPVTRTFDIDVTPPTGTIVTSVGSFAVQDPVVTLVPSIAGASHMRFEPGWGPTDWSSYEPLVELTYPGEGRFPLVAQFRDLAGNTLTFNETVTVDWTVPSTFATGLPESGPAVGEAAVSLVATDAVGGVASIRYSLDGAGVQTYTQPVIVAVEGTHTLEFSAIDLSGNREATKSVEFGVFKAFPIEMRLAGGRAIVAGRQVSVESSATEAVAMSVDTGSGYGQWVPFEAMQSLTLPADGAYAIRVRYRSVHDVVLERSGTILIDTVRPSVGRVASSATRLRKISGDWLYDLSFSWSATDSGSGVSGHFWRFGTSRGQSTQPAVAVTGVPATATSFVVNTLDQAGNRTQVRRGAVTGWGPAPTVPAVATQARPPRVVARVARAGHSYFLVHGYRLQPDGTWARVTSRYGLLSPTTAGALVVARPPVTSGTWVFVLEQVTATTSSFSPPSAQVTVP